MPYVPSYTAAQLQNLERMLTSGVTSSSYEGRSITFRSLDELRLAIYEVRRALYGTGIRRLLTRTRDDKGL